VLVCLFVWWVDGRVVGMVVSVWEVSPLVGFFNT
jgi:hypothetical protein